MHYSIEPTAIKAALDFCEFKPTPSWARSVLVVWPHSPELIDKLLEYACVVTVVVDNADDFAELRAIPRWQAAVQAARLKVVYSVAVSYVMAAPIHSFVAVFIGAPLLYSPWQLIARRVLTWNGRLNYIGSAMPRGEHAQEGNTVLKRKIFSTIYMQRGAVLDVTSADIVANADKQHFVISGKKPIGWMIASYPRCGTHMLVTALDSHSELRCNAEAFNPSAMCGSHRFETVQQVLENSWPDGSTGFAIHSSIDREGHSLSMPESVFGHSKFWSLVPNYTPTILVRRKNLLARYVSQLVAMSTGLWNSTDSSKEGESFASVYVDIKEFEQDMRFVKDCWDNAAAHFRYSVVVDYEDMVTDFDVVSRRVQQFLGVSYEPIQPATVKLAVSMEETVENYVQVRAWCRRNGLGHFIEEQGCSTPISQL